MNTLVRTGVAIATLLLATACAEPRNVYQLAHDAQSMCIAAGYPPHAEEFASCTLSVMQSERANDAQLQHAGTGAGIQVGGAVLSVVLGVLLPFLFIF